MRLARKLFLLAVTAVAALALTATTASAQVEVTDETNGGGHCTAANNNNGVVTGGCHIEVISTEHIPLVAFVPQRVVLSNCDVHLEARVGEDGEGWVTAAHLETEPEGQQEPVPCTRAPCDTAAGAMIPWRIHIVENVPGDPHVEATFCLRLISAGPGGAGTQCEVHLEFSQDAAHNIEIGHHPSGAVACEVSPSPPAVIAIEKAHFTYEVDSDRIEVVH